MKPHPAAALAAATMVAILGAALVSAAVDPVNRIDAARLQAKIEKISKTGAGARPVTPVRTAVTEAEVNAYLRYELTDKIPAGVTDPSMSMLGDGRVSGRATVDLSQVAKSRKTSGGILDPYRYLTGSLPIAVDGIVKAKDGVATFSLESATISGMSMPVWMLQEIVTSYTRSAASPKGMALDQPFPLPAGIREIQLDRGQAIVIQ